jgi:hypothetical protein
MRPRPRGTPHSPPRVSAIVSRYRRLSVVPPFKCTGRSLSAWEWGCQMRKGCCGGLIGDWGETPPAAPGAPRPAPPTWKSFCFSRTRFWKRLRAVELKERISAWETCGVGGGWVGGTCSHVGPGPAGLPPRLGPGKHLLRGGGASCQKATGGLGAVAHGCNPSYSGGGDGASQGKTASETPSQHNPATVSRACQLG